MIFKAIKICAILNTGLKIIVIIRSFELEVKANSDLKEKTMNMIVAADVQVVDHDVQGNAP